MRKDILKKMDTELHDVVQYILEINGIDHNMNSALLL